MRGSNPLRRHHAIAMLLLAALPVTTRAQTPQTQRRIDPILRAALNRYVLGPVAAPGRAELTRLDRAKGLEPAPTGGDEAWVRVLVKGSGVAGAVRALGGSVGAELGPVATARLPLSALYALAEAPGIEFIEASTPHKAMLDSALIGANVLPLHGAGYNLKGSGVLVGIYDTGIDYTHGDFITAGGTSRVRYLWDQTVNDASRYPSPFSYGSEWTQANLNDEIDGTPASLVTQYDYNGHGTHVAGIAAGNGLAAGKYPGVAPEADLIVIKGGDGSFSSTDIIDGIAYFFAQADALARPGVINLSLGGHSGPHDGTSAYETAIDNAIGTGKVVVVSAGNEANDHIHDRRSLTVPGARDSFQVTIDSYTPNLGTGNDYLDFNIWYAGTASVSITFVAPDETRYGPYASGTLNGAPLSDDGYIYCDNAQFGADLRNGDKNIDAQIWDQTVGWEPAAGTWRIVFQLTSGTATAVDTWLPDMTFAAYMTSGTPDYSVGHPGTAIGALTVGAWVTNRIWTSINTLTYYYPDSNNPGDIATFSSWGPTRDGRRKPDIVAPGQGIFSALSSDMTYPDVSWVDPSGVHRLSQGTSQAAPVVTGAVALLLQADPTLTADQVKQHLRDTASTDSYTGSIPSDEWGYGKLDAQAAVDAVLATTGTAPVITLYQPTGMQQGSVTVSYQIEDTDLSPVDLTVEYSDDHGSSWYTATTTGLTTGISAAEYDSAFVWVSDGDLYPFSCSQVWLRVTPSDGVPGTADITKFPLDNQEPAEVTADGIEGENIINFWFDEPVDIPIATNTSNYALSGGLSPASIAAIEGAWAVDPLPAAVRGPGGAVIDGEAWVVGGYDGSTYRTSLYRYNNTIGAWEQKADLPTPREAMVVAEIDGLLYVAGGETGGPAFHNVLEIYDPDTDTWTSGASLATARSWASYGVIEGRLYVSGGMGLGGALTSGEVYDPASDTWIPIAAHPQAKQKAAFGVIDRKLYVAGGAAPPGVMYTSLHVYEPETDTWTVLSDMVPHRHSAASGVVQDRLYIAGGLDDTNQPRTEIFWYWPAASSWGAASVTLDAVRDGARGLSLDEHLYVAGGYRDWTLTTEVTEFDPSAYYELTLGAGQTLPAVGIILEATGIEDRFGNVSSYLATEFTPATVTPPSVIVRQPEGTRSGDVPIHFIISDPEGDPVDLLIEYSTDGSSWQTATVADPGGLCCIDAVDYDNWTVWASGDDLGGQDWATVWVRITPSDATGDGASDQTAFPLDNQPPGGVLGHGGPGDRTKIRFWFDEPVIIASARDVSHYTISEGLTIQSILRRDSWEEVTEAVAPTARVGAATAVIGNKVYVAGGQDAGANKLDLLEIYDTDTQSWSTGATMPGALAGAAGGVIDGKWYLAGGAGPSGSLNTVVVYDPTSDTWSSGLETMSLARAGCRGAVVDGLLYVMGGDALTQTAVEVYDPKGDTWTTRSSYSVPRGGAVVGVIQGFIYLAGGYDNANLRSELEVYDPQNDLWSTLAPMPEARNNAAGGALGYQLVVAGGQGFGEYKSETYLYDPSTDQWFPALSMPEARSAANSIIDDERLYVAGGFNTGGTMLTSILEYDPQAWYVAQLAPGQSLPDNSVTLEAAGILDLRGNEATWLSTDILPYELSAHISGTAYDVNPNPIEGMRLLLRPTGQAWIDTTYTDANGEYWFDMAPGTYEVHGQKIHDLNYYETAWLDSFQVDLGQTVVHDLDITQGPTFGVASVDINSGSGSIAMVNTGDAVAVTMDYAAWNDAVTPLSNEWLVLGLGSAGYSGYSLGTTPVYPGAGGTASFSFTAPTTGGTYTLYVKRVSGTTTEAGALLRYNARFWNVDWEYIPVGTLEVTADGTIAGTVYEPDTSNPIPDAKVRLRPDGSTAWSDSTVTGTDGTYSFAVSAGSYYNIFVEALSGNRYLSSRPEDTILALSGVTTPHNPPLGVGYGFQLENLSLAVTGSDSMAVQPGGSVLGTLTLRTWDAWGYGGDVSLLIGIGSGAQDLDYRVVTTPGDYTGTSGDITLDLQAPGTSGTYPIYVVLDRDGIPTSDDYEDRFPFDQEFAFLPVGTVLVDGTAPTPATGVDMGGSGSSTSAWTNDSAGMRVWFNVPADPSGISGVRYKLVPAGDTDEPPQDETITDTALAQYDSGNVKWYFDLVLTDRVNDGSNHLYFWLVDGAGNYSFTQWSEGWINFDATGPSEPGLLTPSSGATVDTQRPTFTWSAATDATTGVSWYVLRVGTNVSMGEIVYQPASPLNSSELYHTPTADLPNGNYYWSVYAEDLVGNVSTWTARPITISAATMEQPVLVSVTGGDWSNQDVTPLSWNAVSGASQYYLQLTTLDDPDFSAFFYGQTTSQTSFSVGVGSHGDGEYRWRVRAEAGLDFSPWSETTFRLDRTAPSLTVEALPTSISTGQAITIGAHAGDLNGLQFVRLYYRESGVSSGFTQTAMSFTGGDAFQGEIPGSVVGMNGFQYYLTARDLAGNESRADASGGLTGDETGGAQISLPNMPASATLPRDRWQMVSVPHVPDNAGISALLTNIPQYDEKVWRFFRWTGSAYQEVSSASLQPGRGYWLYHRRDGVQLDPGSGHTIPSGRPFDVVLTPGWNDIGSPWLFNVAWTDILSQSGLTDTQVTRPYGYDGTDWVLPPGIGELPVWYGVSVYNRGSSNLTLQVPPLAAGGELVARARTLAEAMAEQGVTAQLPIGRVEEEGGSGWRLQILLSQEGAKAGDVQNYVGVLTGHTEEWDPDDLPDPPRAIEGSARVMVDRTGRALDRGWYATDYQGPGEPGWEWPLRVESVQGGRRVNLTFRGLTGLSDGVTAALVDVRSNLRIDLTEGSSYRFFPGTNAGQPPLEGTAVEHAFRLVAGSAAFVDARTAGTIRLPAEASLDQNYPNPFNPTTTIRFALAEPSRVRITVLNVRGQQVAVLADGLYNAGPHTLQWDGRDATGRAAASGIYFYRLEAAGKVISKKMTLIR